MAGQGCIRTIAELGKGAYLTNRTAILNAFPAALEILNRFELMGTEEATEEAEESVYRELRFLPASGEHAEQNPGNDLESIRKTCLEQGLPWPLTGEAHVILAKENRILVHAASNRGLLYGAVSLVHLAKGGYLRSLLYYNAPICEERGMKVFVPSGKNIPFFKKFVDMLVYYKFNAIMIEVGGAMEYKRHPEINEGWVTYCEEMSEYSGKTTIIQDYTYPWYKNAIHMENGDGGYLSQREMRELVDYCRERELEVIPEVPSLGHCDYLMLGHPEIAERPEDPYPDTYCPSNEASYALLFDVIDEIVEVFRPVRMNIGHDEYYTIGVCEKCKQRKADDIFAEDVNRIADYLKEKHVGTVIWGDKLLRNAVVQGAGPFGGAEIIMYTPAFHQKDGKVVGIMPATYGAVKKIHRDVEILHWTWGLSGELEDELLEEGLNIRYGNFDSYLFPDWQEHMKKGSKGAMISNWSTLNEEILQRNGIFFNIAYAYEMFWNPEYREDDFEQIRKQVFESLYEMKNPVRKGLSPAPDEAHPAYLEMCYQTDYHPEFKWFVDGVFPEDALYEIGNILLEYGDGAAYRERIRYGENIGFAGVGWERSLEEGGGMYKVDDHLIETSYSTLPVQEDGQTWFRYLVRNPFPEKELKQVKVEIREDKDCRIAVKEVRRLG